MSSPVIDRRRSRRQLLPSLSTKHRTVFALLVAWLPLALITLAESGPGGARTIAFWEDVGLHSRFLVCTPLLILAQRHVIPRLTAIARHFTEAGLITEADRPAYEAAIVATRERMESRIRRFITIPLAYAIVLLVVESHGFTRLPDWARASNPSAILTTAGWWNALVSMPLLLELVLSWLWRLLAWAWLLRRLARLDLQLIASHPDRCAGLGFTGNSLRAFAPVALALSTLAAGQSAQLVLHGDRPPTPFVYFNIIFMLFLAAVFTIPLTAFGPKLTHAWRRASYEYGALAHRQGQLFERRWLADAEHDASMLDTNTFSATTDLYQVVSNVYGIRFVPVGMRDLVILGGAMLVPFVPVLLLTVPLEVIWSGIKGILF